MSETEPYRISPSSLDDALDCTRRATAKVHGDAFAKAAGIPKDTAKTPPSLSMLAGTITHAAIEHYIKTREDKHVMAIVMGEYNRLTKQKYRSDKQIATVQDLLSITKTMVQSAISNIKTKRLGKVNSEQRLTAETREFALSGAPDLWGEIDGTMTLIDIKTGSSARPMAPLAQLGAYITLVWNLRDINLKKAIVWRITHKGDWSEKEYDKQACLAAYAQSTNALVMAGEHLASGDFEIIPSNHNSTRCSNLYCPIFATKGCTSTKGKIPNE